MAGERETSTKKISPLTFTKSYIFAQCAVEDAIAHLSFPCKRTMDLFHARKHNRFNNTALYLDYPTFYLVVKEAPPQGTI
ncbi:hypothetical protein PAPYR_1147 [Paratrimastix pyriformis]|uniref:Uncharacterized protein n=1 Tax=Paratrimastix pyriformis TaxID=342808 RepID=A0ABQ8V0A6_9EUKA|nr:hypothetical protein PAPYR_1147 [Paratrimastix pyriformis]